MRFNAAIKYTKIHKQIIYICIQYILFALLFSYLAYNTQLLIAWLASLMWLVKLYLAARKTIKI